MNFDKLLNQIKEIHGSPDPKDKLLMICDILQEEVIHYDWVGVYITNNNTLELGPFSGHPTEHMFIPFGEGICGTAAQKKETIVVSDVTQEPNYLSCSPDVKSEIVIPIVDNKENVIAVLDIDSHTADAFTDDDRKFLEEVSEIIRLLL